MRKTKTKQNERKDAQRYLHSDSEHMLRTVQRASVFYFDHKMESAFR